MRYSACCDITRTELQDDLTDVDRLARAIQNADAVISAVGAPLTATTIEETDALVRNSAQVIEAVRKAQVGRLIVVGGCGSLWISPGVKVVDSDKWPVRLVPIAQSHMKLLTALQSSGLNWTYVSPPMLIDLGERTGKYRTGLDDLVVDEAGRSWISFEDYAIALGWKRVSAQRGARRSASPFAISVAKRRPESGHLAT